LIHIFEYEWKTKSEEIKMLLHSIFTFTESIKYDIWLDRTKYNILSQTKYICDENVNKIKYKQYEFYDCGKIKYLL
jgi:hypothetical protein